MSEVINLTDKLTRFDERWTPKIVAQLNDYHVKVVKVEGGFVWHQHADTDELFIVLRGELEIEMRDRTLRLREGELCVVPRGVEHRPVAARECHILLLEPAGLVNTGNAGGSLTAPGDVWI